MLGVVIANGVKMAKPRSRRYLRLGWFRMCICVDIKATKMADRRVRETSPLQFIFDRRGWYIILLKTEGSHDISLSNIRET